MYFTKARKMGRYRNKGKIAFELKGIVNTKVSGQVETTESLPLLLSFVQTCM